jgi:hypothetical protein
MHGGSAEIFEAQTGWIAENREAMNIVFVTQLGDCVEHGDQFAEEWHVADAAMSRLEDPAITGLDEGVPYGVAVGNHDQSPGGNPDGSTASYNEWFGEARFTGRAYYGGHYGANNDNHYQLFRGGRRDFIVIHLEYDRTPDAPVLDWADDLLKTHADREAIIVTHHLLGVGDPGEFGPQGQAIYDALKDNPNLFLMLGGHVGGPIGEGRREDTFEGRRVYSLLSDYQSREHGGNGLLRIMRFSPTAGEIAVSTYSPYADVFERDADSEFTMEYDRQR